MHNINNTSRKSVIVILACFFSSILFISQPFAEPVAIYHFDGDATDASGNGNDLTICFGNVTWIEGIHGQAAFMKHKNPFLNNAFTGAAGALYPGSGELTVEAWVKLPGYGIFNYIFAEPGFEMKIMRSEAQFSINPKDTNKQSRTVSAPLPFGGPGRWFHIAGVYDYDEIYQLYRIRLYINGELLAYQATATVPATSWRYILKTSQIHIGHDINRSTTDGFAVDEIAIHHAALKPDEFYGLQVHKLPDAAITGYITDSSTGEALQSAVVTVTPGDYREVTDSNGKYFVEVFGGSDYTVTANKTNYTTTAQNGFIVEDGNTVDVNVALERFSTSTTVAYYHFDGNGADAGGNGYDFTVHEKVTWVDGIQGKAGMAVSEIESNSFVLTNYGLYYPGTGDWTVEMWIRLQDYDPIGVSNVWGNGSFHLGIFAGEINYRLIPSTGKHVILRVPTHVNADEWAHIACVYRYKESMQIYGNGELLAEEITDKVPLISPPWHRVYMGSDPYTDFMIDELRISSAALSPEEFLYQGPVSVEESETPQEFSLSGNYPNPFNLTTTIEFSLSEAGFTELYIYNVMGQKVRELVADTMQAGNHSVVWDGKDDSGNNVASGIYLSRLVSGENMATNSMLLLK